MRIWLGVAACVFLVGCDRNAADTTVGGSAAGSVGAALAMTSSSGTQSSTLPKSSAQKAWEHLVNWIPDAIAAGACPTMLSPASSICVTGASKVTLIYDSCYFPSMASTWTGRQEISGTGVTCGAIPTSSITRQFVDTSSTPSSATRTGVSTITIDHATANLGNYQGDTISANIGTGYGVSVAISSGVRTSVVVRQRLTGTLFDQSIAGTLSITETSGAVARTASGTITTYYNLLKVKGTTTFTSVRYEDTCCLPVSGTVSTVLASTSQSEAAGIALNGATESLTFAGCGLASLTNTAGTVSTVAVSGCF